MPIKFLNNLAVDSDVLYVDAELNRVGIGTDSPATKLQVNGDFTINSLLPKIILNEDDLTSFSIINNIGDFQINNTTEGANDNLLTILRDDGRVGIGETNPSAKLHVIGNILATGTILGSNLSGTNTGDQDLSGYALTSHNHDGVYQPAGTYNTTIGIDGFINTSGATIIDNIYVTDGVITSFGTRTLSIGDIGAAAASHNHDDRYYTETESDSRFVNVTGDTMTGDLTVNGHIYGRSVNGQYSNLYRMGGVYFTWDSDSYGTNFNHSITSTSNGVYGDDITINSYGNVRINIDSNSNGTDTFSVGHHSTGTGGTLLTLDESGNHTVTGSSRAPIFYDSDNTGYYLNPASTSLLNRLELNGAIDMRARTGTWIESNVMTDSIGWNTSYGVYIGSNIGGTHYLRGNGTFTTGGSTYNLWHAGNDGPGSGLDADTLDGIDSSSFLRSDTNDTFTGNELHFPTLDLSISNNNSQNQGNTYFRGDGSHFVLGLNSGNTLYLNYGNSAGQFRAYGNGIYWNDSFVGTPWGSNNDGSGSGLDADLLDGSQGSAYIKENEDRRHKVIRFTGEGGNSSNPVINYGIYQEGGAWSFPFPDLVIGYHTGIKIGGYKNYNGTRFYNDAPGRSGASVILSVGDGSDDVVATSSFRAPIFYDSNNTAYYLNPAGTSTLGFANFEGFDNTSANSRTTTGVSIGRYTSDYSYIELASTHGTNRSWIDFSDASGSDYAHRLRSHSDRFGIYSSSGEQFRVFSTYTDSVNSSRAPIFYDSNNTSYYIDPASTSILNTLNTNGGDITATHFGIANTSSSSRDGISLYGGAAGNEPTYGLLFTGTSLGTHGGVTGNWATYFTMSNTSNRGWIFRRAGAGNSASISATGLATFDDSVRTPIFYDSNDTSYYIDPANTSTAAKFAGNVGIGTTSPSTKLQVDGDLTVKDNTNAKIHLNEDDLSIFTVQNNVSDFQINNTTEGGNDNLLTIQSGGNVGIGTTGPDTKLQVNGDLTINSVLPKIILNEDYITTYSIKNDYGIFRINDEWENNNILTIYGWNGYVGINDTSPSYQLDVNGTIRATGDVIAFSDIRVKENITTIENALDKVKKLRGVEYNKIDNPERSIGVIAQEIEEVIPEVVREDDQGMKSVAYGNITAVLIEAIKEQQKQIDELKSIINAGSK